MTFPLQVELPRAHHPLAISHGSLLALAVRALLLLMGAALLQVPDCTST